MTILAILLLALVALLLLALATAIVLFVILIVDSLLWGHDLPTSRRAIRVLAGLIARTQPPARTFYDLGCGRGTVALAVKRRLPQLAVWGIDDNGLRIFLARMKAKLLGREIHFRRQDISQVDVRGADVIYLYLWYDVMPSLEEKLKKELKPGAVVITNTSKFAHWQPIQTVATYPQPSALPDFETLFVYQKDIPEGATGAVSKVTDSRSDYPKRSDGLDPIAL